MSTLSFPRHLLGIEGLAASDAVALLDAADGFYDAPSSTPPALRGDTVFTAFFEASTRTRTSFEIAARRLGASVLSVALAASSVTKGETLLDTVRTIAAMGASTVVLRHAASGAARLVAERTGLRVVNAGDGLHEHPTQALLDALTIRRRFGRLTGLTVAICGDIAHSRVARSNALLLGLLGANVRFAGPRTLLPARVGEVYGVEVHERIEPALEGADVVMMLRIQRERLAGSLLPSAHEYANTFGLDAPRLARAKPNALVMHPGPMNRGVEIDTEIADGPQSAVLDQVRAGVAVRTAVLAALGAAATN